MIARTILIAVLVVAAWPSLARAQTSCSVTNPYTGDTCSCACDDDACASACGAGGGGGGDSSSSAASDAQYQADLQNALAGSVSARDKALRTANQRGIAAYKKQQWALAISYFEGALSLDPGNALFAENLAQARAQQEVIAADQRALQALVSGPPVVASTLSEDVHPYLSQAIPFLRDRATTIVGGIMSDEIQITTSMGLFLHVEKNVATLPSMIVDWILAAATGNMTAEEGSRLDKRAAAVIFNVGEGPGELLQSIIEVRDGAAAVMDHATKKVTEVAEHGVSKLAEVLGAGTTTIATASLQLAKDAAAAAVQFWKKKPAPP